MKIKYNSDADVGCLAVIVVVLTIVGLIFAVDAILAKIVIWIANGLFNCDWSDKFWQVLAALIILPMIFNLNIKVGKND